MAANENDPAKRKLLQQSDLLNRLVSSLSEFVVILLDLNGVITSWHPAVETEFGYERNEFVGQFFGLLFTKNDQALGVPRKELDNAIRTGRSGDSRWMLRKDGQQLYVDGILVSLHDPDGVPLGFGKILQNVTRRKRAEDHLEAVNRALEESSVLVRRWSGVIEHWTYGCQRLYGWTAREAAGKVADELLKTKYPEPLITIQKSLMETGVWNGLLEKVRRDGTLIHVACQFILLKDAAGEPMSVIETHTDVTDRWQLQGQLKAANSRLAAMALELERSNQELEEFARIASHDLSAPITSTRWLVDLLRSQRDQQPNAHGQEWLTQIAENLERMSDLIDAVLTHARAGTSTVRTSSPTASSNAVRNALGNLKRDLDISGAAVSLGFLPELYVERQALTQLFQNLVSNAIKYRDPSRPLTIEIGATWRDTLWQIDVADNGIGIEDEWFERIFQPLQRLHGREIPGSGIGLATCKKIVERAGGAILVSSAVGVGSVFTFSLPGEPPGSGDQSTP